MTYEENLSNLFKLIIGNKDESFKRQGYEIPRSMVQKGKESSYFFLGKKQYRDGACYIGKSQDVDGHILVLGGAGTGKSSCIAIPTLLTWRGPIFAIDIKGELTRGWKCYQQNAERSYKVFEFSCAADSCRYDPFYFLRESDPNDLVQNAREIAQAIIPIQADMREPFWSQAAQNVLTAVILYVCGKEAQVVDPDTGEKTGEVLRGTFNDAMELIQSKPIWELIDEIGKSKNEAAIMHINQFREIMEPEDNKMLTGIAAELSNRIMIFATDNRIKTAFTPDTEVDLLRWEDLENTSVFMRIPEDKLGQWDGAIALMLIQLIRTLERRPDRYSPEAIDRSLQPVLLLLDEFPRLGKMDVIQNAVSTLRSKGVTICLIMQSLAQLDKTYGREIRRIILDNCQYKAILGVTDPDSQKTISDMIGSIFVKNGSVSHTDSISDGSSSGSSYGDSWGNTNSNSRGNNKSANFTLSIVRELIIFPHELATLKDILLITPEGFCRVEKVAYYSNTRKHQKPNS